MEIHESFKISRNSEGKYLVQTEMGKEKQVGYTECIHRHFICETLDAAFSNIIQMRKIDLPPD